MHKIIRYAVSKWLHQSLRSVYRVRNGARLLSLTVAAHLSLHFFYQTSNQFHSSLSRAIACRSAFPRAMLSDSLQSSSCGWILLVFVHIEKRHPRLLPAWMRGESFLVVAFPCIGWWKCPLFCLICLLSSAKYVFVLSLQTFSCSTDGLPLCFPRSMLAFPYLATLVLK